MITWWHDDMYTGLNASNPKLCPACDSLTHSLTRVKSRDASASKKIHQIWACHPSLWSPPQCLKRGTFSSIALVSIALVSVTTFYMCALTMMCLIAVWLKMTIHQVCVWSKQDFMNTIITTSMFIANLMTVIMVIKIIKMLIRMMTNIPIMTRRNFWKTIMTRRKLWKLI